MPTLSLTDVTTGNTINASDTNNNNTLIETAVNGLDGDNFAAGKIFDLTKLKTGTGVTGNLLRFDGTNYAPFQPPACRAIRSTTQTINASSSTAIQFNAADSYDTTGSMHDTATNNTRVVIPITGIYAVVGRLEYAEAPAGSMRGGFIRVNGSISLETVSGFTDSAPGDNFLGLGVPEILGLTATHYLELMAKNDDTVSATVRTASLSVVYLGHI